MQRTAADTPLHRLPYCCYEDNAYMLLWRLCIRQSDQVEMNPYPEAAVQVHAVELKHLTPSRQTSATSPLCLGGGDVEVAEHTSTHPKGAFRDVLR